ncbi:uncharacterized protein TRAVEDRAFT_43971 [Trametes versicolor FP-101664 SS1]|uniref:uncharacterized protein n=1 Tax=Trametes versicolor (strain FP-101664) TaxID=717944 RepID=UPI000462263C|nr:uncharacterized protein TRAVEDRAFT_43971 [Trametes versicolor FP-101664 SS1]EIW61144.1 hypothetical protein TRAVEDRAFT_43971 [Trametes versicolor FP-101664 SS1]
MSSLAVRVDVDDEDPLGRIIYSSGWGVDEVAGAYNDTLHWAEGGGLTATFKFTGTLVSVMVCVEETKDGGYPSASFVIDGQNYGTVAASPSSTESLFNITLFTSPNLPAGEHTLVVTNLNGTRPNVFWLDRIWYISSAVSNATSSSASSAASTAASSGPSPSPASSSPSSASPSETPAPPAIGVSGSGSSAGSHGQNLGAIIGGSVGGAVALILLALAGFYFFKRRSARRAGQPHITPIEHDSPEDAPFVGHRPQFAFATPSTSNPTVPSSSFLASASIVSSSATTTTLSPSRRPTHGRDNSLSPLLSESHPSDGAGVSASNPSAFTDKSNSTHSDATFSDGAVNDSTRSPHEEPDMAPPPYAPS